jgi:alanyl-tRNA synthetase
MQYNRDENNQLTPLPRPSIDTGLGLERMAAIVQGKTSNYDTDLLRPLIGKASELSAREYGDPAGSKRDDIALRVIADHSRAIAFLVAEGVLPSNEGRGYVLRKIVRRAADFGRLLGVNRPFLFEMAAQVAVMMREPYPELQEGLHRITTIVKAEEQRYAHTIPPAVERFRKQIVTSKPQPPVLDGRDMFFAYDTLGLRPDYLRDLAMEWDWQVAPDADVEFEEAMKAQRERAKASWKGVGKEAASPVYQKLAETHRSFFDGYHQTQSRDCRIVGLVTEEQESADEVPAGVECEVVLDHTPFYAEAGGQVGDTGTFWDHDLTGELAEVKTTYHPLAGIIAHGVVTKVPLRVGDHIAAAVDVTGRAATARNHTATHLLHAALRSVLGPHVKQAGSVVAADRLRFDFSHYTSVDPEELEEIEHIVNEQILGNAEVHTEVTDLDAALSSGALAFFGDKYPEQNVRVVSVPDFSRELCGGTHVRRTGEIGLFKIMWEGSIAAGVRRVEALTGEQALEDYRRASLQLRELAATLNTSVGEIPQQIRNMMEELRRHEKNEEALKRRLAQSQVDELIEQVRLVRDVKVLAARLREMDRPEMRSLADTLRQKIGSGVIVLASSVNGKVAIVSAVTKDLAERLHAGKIAQAVAKRVGGTGGGRADLAEAGGKDVTELDQALKEVYGIVEAML